MVDHDMKYCPKCDDEYMPEIVNCGVCGTRLLNSAELRAQKDLQQREIVARKGALTPEDDVVTIFKGALADVKKLDQQLRDVNIGTLIWGDKPSGCGKGCCGGGDLELRVRREDAQAAVAIVEADFDRSTAYHAHNTAHADYGFDPAAAENSCPACGCIFSSASSTCPDCGLCFG